MDSAMLTAKKSTAPVPASHEFREAMGRFDAHELLILKKTFSSLAAKQPTPLIAETSPARGSARTKSIPCIDRAIFSRLFPLPGLLGERLFALFDRTGTGTVDFEEFMLGLAVCCRGTAEEKLRFLFTMWDLSGDGSVSAGELVTILNQLPRSFIHLLDIRGRVYGSESSAATPGTFPTAPAFSADWHTSTVDRLVGQVFADAAPEENARLNFEQFAAWLRRTPEMLAFIQSVFPLNDYGEAGSSAHDPPAVALPSERSTRSGGFKGLQTAPPLRSTRGAVVIQSVATPRSGTATGPRRVVVKPFGEPDPVRALLSPPRQRASTITAKAPESSLLHGEYSDESSASCDNNRNSAYNRAGRHHCRDRGHSNDSPSIHTLHMPGAGHSDAHASQAARSVGPIGAAPWYFGGSSEDAPTARKVSTLPTRDMPASIVPASSSLIEKQSSRPTGPVPIRDRAIGASRWADGNASSALALDEGGPDAPDLPPLPPLAGSSAFLQSGGAPSGSSVSVSGSDLALACHRCGAIESIADAAVSAVNIWPHLALASASTDVPKAAQLEGHSAFVQRVRIVPSGNETGERSWRIGGASFVSVTTPASNAAGDPTYAWHFDMRSALNFPPATTGNLRTAVSFTSTGSTAGSGLLPMLAAMRASRQYPPPLSDITTPTVSARPLPKTRVAHSATIKVSSAALLPPPRAESAEEHPFGVLRVSFCATCGTPFAFADLVVHAAVTPEPGGPGARTMSPRGKAKGRRPRLSDRREKRKLQQVLTFQPAATAGPMNAAGASMLVRLQPFAPTNAFSGTASSLLPSPTHAGAARAAPLKPKSRPETHPRRAAVAGPSAPFASANSSRPSAAYSNVGQLALTASMYSALDGGSHAPHSHRLSRQPPSRPATAAAARSGSGRVAARGSLRRAAGAAAESPLGAAPATAAVPPVAPPSAATPAAVPPPRRGWGWASPHRREAGTAAATHPHRFPVETASSDFSVYLQATDPVYVSQLRRQVDDQWLRGVAESKTAAAGSSTISNNAAANGSASFLRERGFMTEWLADEGRGGGRQSPPHSGRGANVSTANRLHASMAVTGERQRAALHTIASFTDTGTGSAYSSTSSLETEDSGTPGSDLPRGPQQLLSAGSSKRSARRARFGRQNELDAVGLPLVVSTHQRTSSLRRLVASSSDVPASAASVIREAVPASVVSPPRDLPTPRQSSLGPSGPVPKRVGSHSSALAALAVKPASGTPPTDESPHPAELAAAATDFESIGWNRSRLGGDTEGGGLDTAGDADATAAAEAHDTRVDGAPGTSTSKGYASSTLFGGAASRAVAFLFSFRRRLTGASWKRKGKAAAPVSVAAPSNAHATLEPPNVRAPAVPALETTPSAPPSVSGVISQPAEFRFVKATGIETSSVEEAHDRPLHTTDFPSRELPRPAASPTAAMFDSEDLVTELEMAALHPNATVSGVSWHHYAALIRHQMEPSAAAVHEEDAPSASTDAAQLHILDSSSSGSADNVTAADVNTADLDGAGQTVSEGVSSSAGISGVRMRQQGHARPRLPTLWKASTFAPPTAEALVVAAGESTARPGAPSLPPPQRQASYDPNRFLAREASGQLRLTRSMPHAHTVSGALGREMAGALAVYSSAEAQQCADALSLGADEDAGHSPRVAVDTATDRHGDRASVHSATASVPSDNESTRAVQDAHAAAADAEINDVVAANEVAVARQLRVNVPVAIDNKFTLPGAEPPGSTADDVYLSSAPMTPGGTLLFTDLADAADDGAREDGQAAEVVLEELELPPSRDASLVGEACHHNGRRSDSIVVGDAVSDMSFPGAAGVLLNEGPLTHASSAGVELDAVSPGTARPQPGQPGSLPRNVSVATSAYAGGDGGSSRGYRSDDSGSVGSNLTDSEPEADAVYWSHRQTPRVRTLAQAVLSARPVGPVVVPMNELLAKVARHQPCGADSKLANSAPLKIVRRWQSISELIPLLSAATVPVVPAAYTEQSSPTVSSEDNKVNSEEDDDASSSPASLHPAARPIAASTMPHRTPKLWPGIGPDTLPPFAALSVSGEVGAAVTGAGSLPPRALAPTSSAALPPSPPSATASTKPAALLSTTSPPQLHLRAAAASSAAAVTVAASVGLGAAAGAGAAKSLFAAGAGLLEHEGWLYRAHTHVVAPATATGAGSAFRTLRRRWYLQQHNYLFWYATASAAPRGVLFLDGSVVQRVADPVAEARGFHGLSIATSTAHGDRTRVLYAAGAAERDAWLALLRRACRSAPFEEEFDLGRELGAGKFSRVYEAVRRRPGAEAAPPLPAAGVTGALSSFPPQQQQAQRDPEPERFAVKVIEKAALSEAERDLLRTEVAILKLCAHPHIVRFEAVHEDGARLYIVLELLQGGELFTNIVGRSRFSEDEARALARPLADSLAYLHGMGVVHRDLKPENILCSGARAPPAAAADGSSVGDAAATVSGGAAFSWGEIKIADFGLSALVHPEEVLTQACGTLQYAAPEVLSRAGYGKPADMWSLGVLLHLVVRGKLPYDAPHKDAVVHAILHDPPDLGHYVWRPWSAAGMDFVRGLLERDPARRLTARGALQHPWLRTSPAERDADVGAGAAAATLCG